MESYAGVQIWAVLVTLAQDSYPCSIFDMLPRHPPSSMNSTDDMHEWYAVPSLCISTRLLVQHSEPSPRAS